MRVLVDTSVWSLALRRQAANLNAEERMLTQELRDLIRKHRAELIGLIRQELLSGIREEPHYERLRAHLRAFPDEPLTTPDFELAARLSNQCRASGIAGSVVDFLICAVAAARDWAIFTTDPDFRNYARVLGIRLHSAPSSTPPRPIRF